MMPRSAASLTAPILLGAVFLPCPQAAAAAEPVEAVILTAENWEAYAPKGKEVDAIYGDLVLRNERFIAVIAAPRPDRHANLTTRDVGGCLIDFTTREQPNDQLTVYRPGGDDVQYTSLIEKEELPAGASVGVRASDGTETVYSLGPADEYLTVQTTGPAAGRDALRVDRKNEQVADSSGTPADWVWVCDRFWGQAYGVRPADDKTTVSVQGGGRSLDLRFSGAADTSEAGPLIRHLAAGANEAMVWRALHSSAPFAWIGVPEAPLAGSSDPLTRIQVFVPEGEGQTLFYEEMLWPGKPVRRDSEYIPVPAGAVRVEATLPNFPDAKVVATKRVPANEFMSAIRLPDDHRTLELRVTSGGFASPSKIQVRRPNGDDPDYGPPSGEGAVGNLRYTADGKTAFAVDNGDYEITVSRGPEYDAVVKRLSLEHDEIVPVDIPRAFSTLGYISADFHSHSSPSGDNTASQRGRVLNLVCEDIDFAPCTEHQRVDTYDTHIEELGIRDELLSCPGMELTGQPLPLNHHNAFPMRHHIHEQDGGGPVVAGDPDAQVERLLLWDDRSEKLIQQNHPDIAWLFRDRDGDGELDEGFSRAAGLIDCVEVHPIENILQLFPGASKPEGEAAAAWSKDRFVGWLQLLNEGRRLPGVVNTDAHWNYHGSGWLRNWIRVPDDDPATCDVMDIVRATEAGRVIMSNGPFLTMTIQNEAGDTAEIGDDLRSDGRVEVAVRVHCANWLDVDRVGLLVGGRLVKDFRRGNGDEGGDDGFQKEGPLRFEKTVKLTIAADAPVMAICGSETHTLEPVYGPDHAWRKAAAATNPVWVNVGEEEWTPSRDTLDRPLSGKLR